MAQARSWIFLFDFVNDPVESRLFPSGSGVDGRDVSRLANADAIRLSNGVS